MKTISKFFVLAVLSAFVFASCGKYEEGPSISFLSKTARLVNTWKIDKKYKNDTEESLTDDDKDDYFEVMKDGVYKMTIVTVGVSSEFTGEWDLDDTKENLITSYTYTIGSSTVTVKDTTKILRLKSNELWVEDVQGSDTYQYQYITK